MVKPGLYFLRGPFTMNVKQQNENVFLKLTSAQDLMPHGDSHLIQVKVTCPLALHPTVTKTK
jgi:hypothetical protein